MICEKGSFSKTMDGFIPRNSDMDLLLCFDYKLYIQARNGVPVLLWKTTVRSLPLLGWAEFGGSFSTALMSIRHLSTWRGSPRHVLASDCSQQFAFLIKTHGLAFILAQSFVPVFVIRLALAFQLFTQIATNSNYLLTKTWHILELLARIHQPEKHFEISLTAKWTITCSRPLVFFELLELTNLLDAHSLRLIEP